MIFCLIFLRLIRYYVKDTVKKKVIANVLSKDVQIKLNITANFQKTNSSAKTRGSAKTTSEDAFGQFKMAYAWSVYC